MKRSKMWIAAIIAAAICCSCVMPVFGYFTANTQAYGYLTIKPIDTDEKEDIFDKEKQVTIVNSEKGTPVYVRARGFAGDDSDLNYTAEEGWFDGEDGWWYYEPILNPGEQTTKLLVNIEKVLPEGAEPDDTFNVIVVYESVRANGDVSDAKEAFAEYEAQGEGGN